MKLNVYGFCFSTNSENVTTTSKYTLHPCWFFLKFCQLEVNFVVMDPWLKIDPLSVAFNPI